MSVNMADRNSVKMGTGAKPVPMKLFSTWEVETTSHNCVPRLCSLTLSRLVVLKTLEADLTSVIIATKMQNSKRVLRSSEIPVPASGLVDTELELSFSLQYPHYLKRDGNKLQIMLQRRKKYKNRTILGYKTLAIGQVSMSQVLQRALDKELHLYNDLKECSHLLAHVNVVCLSSQPVDHFENGHNKALHPSSDVDNDSDDEDYSSNEEEGSDNEHVHKRGRVPIRPLMFRQKNFKQKFTALLKRFKLSEEVLDSEPDQELVDVDHTQDMEELFDELENLSDSDPDVDQMSVISTPRPSLRPFFTPRQNTESFDSFKDTVKQLDESGRRSDSDSHVEPIAPPTNVLLTLNNIEDPTPAKVGVNFSTPLDSVDARILERKHSQSKSPEHSKILVLLGSPRSAFLELPRSLIRKHGTSFKERRQNCSTRIERQFSLGNVHDAGHGVDDEPRKALVEQLKSVLGEQEDRLPEIVIFVNSAEWQGQYLVQKLQDKQVQLMCTCSMADIKACVNGLVGRLHKFCNSNSQTPRPIKVGMAGSDSYFNSILRFYVDYFSNRSPEWQTFIKFLVIPIGPSNIAKYLSSVDSSYSTLFGDTLWKDTFDKLDSNKLDALEVYNRISTYVTSAHCLVQIPVAQAMVTYKGKSCEEDSSQIFLPFMSDVRIGNHEAFNTSVEIDETVINSTIPSSSSPPQNTTPVEKVKDSHTPPNSPNVGSPHPMFTAQAQSEYMDLQVEFWTSGSKFEGGEKDKEREKEKDKDKGKKESSKCSLKSAFRYLHVSQLPPSSDGTMVMTILTREKKQKIMRIGKKSKDVESKRDTIEGISRLICSSKSQHNRLRVMIDGHEWRDVKFFQLSPQWQTHIKHFPIVIFGNSDAPC